MKSFLTNVKYILIGIVALIAIVAVVIALTTNSYMAYKRPNNRELVATTTALESSLRIYDDIPVMEDLSNLANDEFPTVNFDELRAANPDVVAWVKVPGTNVDYPVVRNSQSSDLHDGYYADHQINHAEGLPGTIYIEPINNPDFADFDTILYGHNMNDGSMFASLLNYMDQGFFDAHPIIYIATPDRQLTYTIASAVVYDDRHITKTFTFLYQDDREAFIQSLYSAGDARSKFSSSVQMSQDAQMISLCTCINGEDDRRFYVTGVLWEN